MAVFISRHAMKSVAMDKAALVAETGRCVACGLCLPHCPTYHKTKSEADSPRGRIMMTQAVVQGGLPLNERYAQHIDLCLTCRACESVCPNQVNYGRIADGARTLIREQHGAPLGMKIATRIIANPTLMRWAGKLLKLANLLGLRQLVKSLPPVARQYRWQSVYAAPEAHGEVCLFLGCVTNALDAETLASSIFVLNHLGYTVHVPPAQTCCAGLHHQAGDSAGAQTLEQRNVDAFANLGDMPILAVASGCGARLMEYLPERVHDINVFLAAANGWENISIHPLNAKVAVQEPCTLRNVMGAKGSQQNLLKHIPDAEIVSLPGNAQCCGGAGSYSLTQPEMAARLRDDKIGAYKTIRSDYIATANIGCALHLAQGFTQAGELVPVVHPVTLIAKQMGFTGDLSCSKN